MTIQADRSWTPPWIAGAVALPSLPGGRILFLSDLHLGVGLDERVRRGELDRFLSSLAGRIDTLVLGGDTFEFWWEWKHALPRGFDDFLDRTRELAESGIKVRFIAGNHDFAIGAGLAERCGATIHPDGIRLRSGTKDWFCFHGDASPPSERADRLVRGILRSRICQAMWGLLPPDVAFRLALGVGRGSRYIEPGPAASTAEMEPMCLDLAHRFGLDGVVHGHTHRPLLRRVGSKTYINNGDWLKLRTAVWIDGDHADLVDGSQEDLPWRSTI